MLMGKLLSIYMMHTLQIVFGTQLLLTSGNTYM
jgi:hypothetical protein